MLDFLVYPFDLGVYCFASRFLYLGFIAILPFFDIDVIGGVFAYITQYILK